MTALPPRVFIRTKKPWVRFLLITDGWYVRFMFLPRVNRKARYYKALRHMCQVNFYFNACG